MRVSRIVGRRTIDLNVDIGEGFPKDAELLRFASSANICCGVHAGSRELTLDTVDLCQRQRVRIGAHPGYPDRESMGRRPMEPGQERVYLKSLFEQTAWFVKACGPSYLKPHGAFYNDTAIVLPHDWQTLRKRSPGISDYESGGVYLAQFPGIHSLVMLLRIHRLALMGLEATAHKAISARSRQPFIREGFADRLYLRDGTLAPRSQSGAVLTDAFEVQEQVRRLAPGVDSICLHGDTPECLVYAEMVYKTLLDSRLRSWRVVKLEVVQAYGSVTRQGSRRDARRRFGVPPGGAFDRESSALANALVGLAEETEAWELGLANVRFRAGAGGLAAVVGTPVPITVDGHGVPSNAAFPLRAGAELHIGPPSSGARAYLAFHAAPAGPSRIRRLAVPPSTLALGPLRVVPGPQADEIGLSHLAGAFRVSTAADRVGIRLEGVAFPHKIELPSEPACIGVVQVTNAGHLVLLGPDGPTIGGYPKVAVVIDADVDRLAQLRPGDGVTFDVVSLEEALAARGKRLSRITEAISQVRLAQSDVII